MITKFVIKLKVLLLVSFVIASCENSSLTSQARSETSDSRSGTVSENYYDSVLLCEGSDPVDLDVEVMLKREKPHKEISLPLTKAPTDVPCETRIYLDKSSPAFAQTTWRAQENEEEVTGLLYISRKFVIEKESLQQKEPIVNIELVKTHALKP